VALALGLNIVVGLAGLLDLGYVAFLSPSARTPGRSLGSPHANVIFGGDMFPLAGLVVLYLSLRRSRHGGDHGNPARLAGAAAARRLPGHRHPGLR